MKFKPTIIGLFIIGLAVASCITLILSLPNWWPTDITYGVTFAPRQASGLGLNWQDTYLAILDDLGVRQLRLVAYWDEIEPAEGKFNWDALDWQMDQAAARGASVILATGRKVPRWPECHLPVWVAKLPEVEQRQKVLAMITAVAKRYQNHPALRMWQLENEPLFGFGVCPPADQAFLRQEESLLRAIDSAHSILITDSGELSSWRQAAGYGDIFGTTMYRTVHSGRTGKLFHYDYIFPAWLYRAKARLVKITQGKDVIISELQGEPWGAKPFAQMSVDERQLSFSPARFKELNSFAQRTQLPEAYWWGVEYWYWEKQANGNTNYWDVARELFDSD